MRSRFSAFALNLRDYLLETWHPDTRPADLELDEQLVWQRLFIESTENGGPFDAVGKVTFTAVARDNEGRVELHECSRFVRLEPHQRWVYLDGAVSD